MPDLTPAELRAMAQKIIDGYAAVIDARARSPSRTTSECFVVDPNVFTAGRELNTLLSANGEVLARALLARLDAEEAIPAAVLACRDKIKELESQDAN